MNSGTYIFRSPHEIDGLYERFVSGLFLVKGLPLLCQLLAITAFLFAAYFFNRQKISKFFSLLGFTSLVILLHQPWDELFVNLMHAKNFAEHENFSFNALRNIEGTVDTLPYFLLGLLHKAGLPLLEMSLVLSWMGGVLCILLGTKITSTLTKVKQDQGYFLAFSLFSPILFNSSHGFSTTLFASAILASLYFIDFKKSNIGWLILSFVPLIRTEGLWFVIVFALSNFFYEKKRNSIVLISFIPALLLLLWRYSKFGFLTPIPMHYKATFGNLFFLLLGIRNFWCDLLASGSLVLLLWYWKFKERKNILDRWLILLILCIFPYYLSGGDWFPAGWGRYAFPFSLVASIAFFSSFDRKKISAHLPLLILTILFLVLPTSSYVGLFEDVFTKKKTLSNTNHRSLKRTNFRIQYLSQVGTHLGAVTDPKDIIATSEMATIHYFANREALDLLGITNEEIATSSLRVPELYRRFPNQNELPYLIFRRKNPGLVEKYRPQIIYPFDFILKDLMEDVFFHEMTNENILKAEKRWENRFKGLMDPLYGGVQHLKEIGYQPFIVLYQNEFATLYFVEKSAVENHIKKLKSKGFSDALLEQKS